MVKKKQFTAKELLRKGFNWETDNEVKYLQYKPKAIKDGKFLVTNDYSVPDEDSWFVDYGLHNPIANLDETLVDDFIKAMDGKLKLDDWFEALVCRIV